MTKFQPAPALMGIAQDMIMKGWQPVWCPARQSGSFSPLPGCTGGVAFPAVLPQPSGMHKLAFRPPPDVLVLDVDDYEDKHGGETLERAERWLGELPMTYRITSRGYSNPSGRYLFRIPADLVVTDSSLYQFADPETGRTDIEVVRTGHRFSWAPGDYHYKNDELIECWDEEGTLLDEMPEVGELPALPEKWVAYFRNPPVPQRREAYTRPSDGAEWWLSQADDSLSTDAELSSFAYNMLLSRVPEEEIFTQWQRVAHANDPAWPWTRSDFERHIGTRAQNKAAEILANQDAETEWFAGTGADLDLIAQRTKEGFDNRQSLLSAVTQPIVEFNQEILHQGFNRLGYDEDDEGSFYQPESIPCDLLAPKVCIYKKGHAEKCKERPLEDQLRSLDSYQRLLFDRLARTQADKDAAKILMAKFEDYEEICDLPDPDKPATLLIRGTEKGTDTNLISPNTVTVVSGHRASGKTWAVATWAAQEIRAGNHVIWVDFERQSRLLVQKLRALHIPVHLIRDQVHYVGGVIPPTERLVSDIKRYTAEGQGRVLVVVDAFRGLQATVNPGSNANDGDAVEAVYLAVLNPVAAKDAGGTVVVIDHLSKTGDTGTFGSERKESAADYVIQVKQAEPFSKRKSGYSTLTVTKDRYGEIEQGTVAGYLWVPGDDDKKKSDEGIDNYPVIPDLRSWCPASNELPEDSAEARLAAMQVAKIVQFVKANPLRYNQSSLAAKMCEDDPALFGNNPESVRTNIISKKMVKEGILKADAGKKLEWCAPQSPAVTEVQVTVPVIDPAYLAGGTEDQE